MEPVPPFPRLQSSGLRVLGADLSPELQLYVHEMYEEVVPASPGASLLIPISATTDPTLNAMWSGEPVVRLRAATFRVPPVALAGPQPEAYAVEYRGEVAGFFVRFTTVGPLALCGVRGYGISERGAPPFHALVRPALALAAQRYGEALVAAPDFAARCALTEHFLLDALATRPRADAEAVPLLEAAIKEIELANGRIRVAALARALGVSEATLRRRFGVLGMQVKRFADVVRFRHAHAHLHTTPGATWPDIVERFGYYDQAHFIRDYRRFSGGPPTRWQPDERIVDRRMGIEGAFDPHASDGGA